MEGVQHNPHLRENKVNVLKAPDILCEISSLSIRFIQRANILRQLGFTFSQRHQHP